MDRRCVSQLGQLVVDSGWLDQNQLEDALAESYEKEAPVGKILCARGHISATELQNVIQAQALVRDGYITYREARQALNVSSWTGVSLERALSLRGTLPKQGVSYKKRLGQLLISSGCIDTETLDDVLAHSASQGLPTGLVMLKRKRLSKLMLNAALESQKLVRSEMIPLSTAISGLSVIKHGVKQGDEHDIECAPPVGRLFVAADLLTEEQITDALEVSSANSMPIGQVLIIMGLVTERILAVALKLQDLVRTGRVLRDSAAPMLKSAYSGALDADELLKAEAKEPSDSTRISLLMFLKRTGLFCGSFREFESVRNSAWRERDHVKILSGFIDECKLQMAVRCTFLVRHCILTLDQAILAFHYALLTNTDIDSFLSKVGWVSRSTLIEFAVQKTAPVAMMHDPTVDLRRTRRHIVRHSAG